MAACGHGNYGFCGFPGDHEGPCSGNPNRPAWDEGYLAGQRSIPRAPTDDELRQRIQRLIERNATTIMVLGGTATNTVAVALSVQNSELRKALSS